MVRIRKAHAKPPTLHNGHSPRSRYGGSETLGLRTVTCEPAARYTTLAHCVLNIFLLSSCSQVKRIYAWPHVARMKDMES